MSFKKIPFWVRQRKTLPRKLDKSRKVVVEKFTHRRTAAGRANQPPPLDLDRIRTAMQRAERDAIAAGVPRPNFAFSPQDVAAIYTQKHGEPGVWFRLKNGRVFQDTGEPDSTNPDAYGD